jgi:uncharacterized protein YjbI with pentapeptide repeats
MMTRRGHIIKPGAALRGALLIDVDLRGANFTGADLTCAVLRGARLAGAGFTRANLHNVDLRGADLAGADLTCANLKGTDLRGTDLAGAVLRRSWVFDARVTSEQLTWLSLTGQLSEAQAQSCVMDTV